MDSARSAYRRSCIRMLVSLALMSKRSLSSRLTTLPSIIVALTHLPQSAPTLTSARRVMVRMPRLPPRSPRWHRNNASSTSLGRVSLSPAWITSTMSMLPRIQRLRTHILSATLTTIEWNQTCMSFVHLRILLFLCFIKSKQQ